MKSRKPAREEPADSLKASSNKKPSIPWAKNPDWTWKLIALLQEDMKFRLKLFSDSTQSAKKEGHKMTKNKESLGSLHAKAAKYIFENDTVYSAEYAKDPVCFSKSIEGRVHL